MDQVIDFPDQAKSKRRRGWFKTNGLTLLFLILLFTLIYQLLSGVYQLFIYNRRLGEVEALLQEKKLFLEELEARLQTPDPTPALEIDQD
ncbi:MAG TPA: hypothetical protein DDZ55_05035 [Firmicutes bacterium]|jgi:hypothetical protein|nr:hypothetical protein [Bacillota bacterium]HBR29479.1 hypothetical protein [Bacillota bacterium]